VGILAALAALAAARQASAYVEIPYTLGRVVQESTNIVLMEVTKTNKERRLIYYKKIADLKGKHPSETINHQISDGFNPREPRFIMEWAEPGRLAMFFYQGGASETCLGDYWYQAYAGNAPWWNMSHAEPFFCWAFSGKVEKLRTLVTDMLAGKEVVCPCAQFDPAKVQEFKNLLHEKKAPLWRLKAGLQIQDYNAVIADKAKYLVGLGALGPEAVPGFVAQLKHADPKVRAKAAEELGQIGADAKSALEPLAAVMGDSDGLVRIRAAEAVARIDEPKAAPAIEIIVKALSDEKLVGTAVEVLSGLRTAARPAVGPLAGLLAGKSRGLRTAAAEALLNIEPGNIDAINALIALLQSPGGGGGDWTVVEPSDLKAAGGARFEIQKDKSALVVGENPAKDTYTMTLRTGLKAVTALRLEAMADERLPNRGPGRAGNGNFVLSKFTPASDGKPVRLRSGSASYTQGGFDASHLVDGSGYGWAVADRFGRTHAATFEIDPVSADAGVNLTLTLEFQQQWAQHQIGRFRLSATGSDDPLNKVRVRAADLLARTGPAGKAGIPVLTVMLGDRDGQLRSASAQALAAMAPDSLPAITRELKNAADAGVRWMCLDALARSGGHAGRVIPQIVEALRDADAGVRFKACETLRPHIGGAHAAVPTLTEWLDNKDAGMRFWGCLLLGEMGGPAKAAVPRLIERVKSDDNVDVRGHAAIALGRMAADARAAAPVLLAAFTDAKIPAGHWARNEIAKAWGATRPNIAGPAIELFDENPALFAALLYNGDTPNFGPETGDRKSGAACLRVNPNQRYAEFVAGWRFPIVEKPKDGEYRFIRFAWKKRGGTGIMIQLCNNGEWARRYHAGNNSVGWNPSIQVDPKIPAEWVVVTRDMFKDFGPFMLTGIALTSMDGEFGLYDAIYIGRTLEDLDRICPVK
jgi:HEAT repeat protein